jgi:osmoprotectant transport system permease protein
VTGLSLNNTTLILKGAIPAAILAIMVEILFEVIEKMFVPKHLQQKIGK